MLGNMKKRVKYFVIGLGVAHVFSAYGVRVQFGRKKTCTSEFFKDNQNFSRKDECYFWSYKNSQVHAFILQMHENPYHYTRNKVQASTWQLSSMTAGRSLRGILLWNSTSLSPCILIAFCVRFPQGTEFKQWYVIRCHALVLWSCNIWSWASSNV